jgi:hypothetical protein
VRRLAPLAVDAELHQEIVRVRDLVRRHDPRAERTERVDRLAEREHAATHLSPLDVARRDVVEDHITADVLVSLLRREPLPGLPDDDRELELVVELLRQVLRVDDRLVRADDRVDVLEEHDPRRDLVRPADALRLLLVLAEVAGGMEELLRDDRRAQPYAVEGVLDACVVRSAALEILAQGTGSELPDDAVLDSPHLAVVEGDELHRRSSSHASTSSAFSFGGKTG